MPPDHAPAWSHKTHQGDESGTKHDSDMYWLHYGPLRPGAADLSGPRVPQASR